ncbi:MAG: hypothetical protein NVSMB57_09170 [Actinomycetota bacterium]
MILEGAVGEERASRLLQEIQDQERAAKPRRWPLQSWATRGERALKETKKIAALASRGRKGLAGLEPEQQAAVLSLLKVRLAVSKEEDPVLEVWLPFDTKPQDFLAPGVPPAGLEPAL